MNNTLHQEIKNSEKNPQRIIKFLMWINILRNGTHNTLYVHCTQADSRFDLVYLKDSLSYYLYMYLNSL